MRILFASLPAYGHAAPLCSLAAELAARGHAVGWVGHAELRGRLLPADAPVWEAPGPGAIHATAAPDRPLTVARAFFGEMLPAVTAAQLPTVRAAIDAFRPDLMVVDATCLAGSLGARLAGVRWVAVHVAPTVLLAPFRFVPGVERWIDAQLGAVQEAHGLTPLRWPIRAELTLIPTSAEFLGPEAELHPGDAFVGALAAHRDGPLEPAWLGPRPRAVVTLGSLAGDVGAAFRARAAAGLADFGTVTVLDPTRWAPLPALLREVDVVVCHGGQNTVSEALLCGVPLVVAPIQFDQHAVAARVAALGAGRIVSFTGASAEEIGAAARAALADETRAAAQRIGDTLRDGAARAADLLEAG